MALNILKALRDLLAQAEDDSGDDTVEEITDDVEAVAENSADETTPDGSETDDVPAETPGESDSDDAGDDDAGETLTTSETDVADLRDALNTLGIENERLRTRLAELGGDSELDDEAADDAVKLDIEDDEYDDEAAQKDIDDQAAQIAALKRED